MDEGGESVSFVVDNDVIVEVEEKEEPEEFSCDEVDKSYIERVLLVGVAGSVNESCMARSLFDA